MKKSEEKPIALGYVHFDTPAMHNYISEFLVTQEMSNKVFRNKYVKIDDANKHFFIGRVIEGPFFLPEEVDRASAFAQTSILRGSKFPVVPNYYALARVEMLGEMEDNILRTTDTRPLPKSPVEDLLPEEVQTLIGLRGEMLMGRLLGYSNVLVKMDADNKDITSKCWCVWHRRFRKI